jgi:hypothetical protein
VIAEELQLSGSVSGDELLQPLDLRARKLNYFPPSLD